MWIRKLRVIICTVRFHEKSESLRIGKKKFYTCVHHNSWNTYKDIHCRAKHQGVLKNQLNKTCWIGRWKRRCIQLINYYSSFFISMYGAVNASTTFTWNFRQHKNLFNINFLKVFEIWSHNSVFSQIFDHTNQKTLSSSFRLSVFALFM